MTSNERPAAHPAGADSAVNPTPDSAADFKRDLQEAFANSNYTSQAALERASKLSHDTVSRALNPKQPIPSSRTVRILTTTLGLQPDSWLRRRDHLKRVATKSSEQRLDSPRAQPAELSVVPGTPRVRTRLRWVIGSGAAAGIAAGAIIVTLATRHTDAQPRVQITEPAGSVARVTTVKGTVTGLTDENLWIDVQSETESRHHITEQPCTRTGNRFTFGPLFVGRSSEGGDQFRITIIATAKTGSANQALVAYAHRPKNGPNAYAGLVALPPGARPVATVSLVRR